MYKRSIASKNSRRQFFSFSDEAQWKTNLAIHGGTATPVMNCVKKVNQSTCSSQVKTGPQSVHAATAPIAMC